MLPFQAIFLSPLLTTTLGWSINCSPIYSPLKLVFGEELRAFPISSPLTFVCCFLLLKSLLSLSPPNTLHDTALLWPEPSGKVGKSLWPSSLMLESVSFILHQPRMNFGSSALPPFAVSSSRCVFFSSGLIKWKGQSAGLLRRTSSQSSWWLSLEKGHRKHL